MERTKEIELIEYSPGIERANTITHAVAAAFALVALVISVFKVREESPRYIVSVLIYCFAFITVYTASAVYHGLPAGDSKRRARVFDHIAIPIMLAGTATPCALITLWRININHGISVLIIAWFCAAFGIVTKLFFFSDEKLKVICMAVYFVGGAVMMLSNIPILGEINKTAFLMLTVGCVLYTVGAVFCKIGIKRPVFHPVFHVFVFLGSLVIFFAIYIYVL